MSREPASPSSTRRARLNRAKPALPGAQSSCPITAEPQLRQALDQHTDAIHDGFPKGIGKPALRALLSAGLTTLDQIAEVSETELAALHGMGPKAISLLRAALVAKGSDFRR